eukprot:TRINITY_DN8343_c0_g1_i1.p1 TRINITY_DN8343_c0_g1~~TRINITY_DN8343_c0_g1_i1.p1  ORF type:complete len:375 (+),score=95.40 TRINITY_DN8343_c0_g1_i1:151-1275(+)
MSGARRRLYPSAFEEAPVAQAQPVPTPAAVQQGAPFQQPFQQPVQPVHQQYAPQATVPGAVYQPMASTGAAWGSPAYPPAVQQQQAFPVPPATSGAPAQAQPGIAQPMQQPYQAHAPVAEPAANVAAGAAHTQKLHKRVFYTEDPEGGPSSWQQPQEPVPMMQTAAGPGVQQMTAAMQQMNVGGAAQRSPAPSSPGFQQPSYPPPQQQAISGQAPQGAYQPASTMGGAAETPSALVTPAAQCPSLYMRMTVNGLPQSEALFKKSCLPFGCVFHPMAVARTPQDKVPVVNFGAAGVIRCRKCRTYINPFVVFVDAGRRWRCNVCSISNDVPADYYAATDSSGRRVDVHERPELNRGRPTTSCLFPLLSWMGIVRV